MFESGTWYKEVLILGVIIPIIGYIFYFFIPLPFGFVLYYSLLIGVAIWRVSKKALSGKEAILIILMSIGFNFVTGSLIPWPFSLILSVSLTFFVVWILHKRS